MCGIWTKSIRRRLHIIYNIYTIQSSPAVDDVTVPPYRRPMPWLFAHPTTGASHSWPQARRAALLASRSRISRNAACARSTVSVFLLLLVSHSFLIGRSRARASSICKPWRFQFWLNKNNNNTPNLLRKNRCNRNRFVFFPFGFRSDRRNSSLQSFGTSYFRQVGVSLKKCRACGFSIVGHADTKPSDTSTASIVLILG